MPLNEQSRIFDHVIKATTIPTGFKGQVLLELIIESDDELMLTVGFIPLTAPSVPAEVDVFNKGISRP